MRHVEKLRRDTNCGLWILFSDSPNILFLTWLIYQANSVRLLSAANVRVFLQVFQQSLRRPLMADCVPMSVMFPMRIRNSAALASNVFCLIDDGNAALFGQCVHPIKRSVSTGAHSMCGQYDQRNAILVRACLELI